MEKRACYNATDADVLADKSNKVFTKTYTVNTAETLTAKDIAGNMIYRLMWCDNKE